MTKNTSPKDEILSHMREMWYDSLLSNITRRDEFHVPLLVVLFDLLLLKKDSIFEYLEINDKSLLREETEKHIESLIDSGQETQEVVEKASAYIELLNKLKKRPSRWTQYSHQENICYFVKQNFKRVGPELQILFDKIKLEDSVEKSAVQDAKINNNFKI